MGMKYTVNGKIITLTDEAVDAYFKAYAANPPIECVKAKIECIYGTNIFTGKKGQTIDEAVKTHTEAELSKKISEAIISDVSPEKYGGTITQEELNKLLLS